MSHRLLFALCVSYILYLSASLWYVGEGCIVQRPGQRGPLVDFMFHFTSLYGSLDAHAELKDSAGAAVEASVT